MTMSYEISYFLFYKLFNKEVKLASVVAAMVTSIGVLAVIVKFWLKLNNCPAAFKPIATILILDPFLLGPRLEFMDQRANLIRLD